MLTTISTMLQAQVSTLLFLLLLQRTDKFLVHADTVLTNDHLLFLRTVSADSNWWYDFDLTSGGAKVKFIAVDTEVWSVTVDTRCHCAYAFFILPLCLTYEDDA